MSVYNRLLNELEALDLKKMKELLPTILDEGSKSNSNLSLIECLHKLASAEIEYSCAGKPQFRKIGNR